MRAFSLLFVILLASNVVLGHNHPKGSAPAQSAAAAALAQSKTGTVRVLVGFQVDSIGAQSTDDASHANAIATSRANFMSQFTITSPASGEALTPGINVTRQYDHFPFAAMDVNAAALTALEANGLTTSVQVDEIHKPSLYQLRPLIGATTVNAAGITGAGQYVAILDTGFDTSHVFLQGQFDPTLEACFSTPNTAQGVSSNCPNKQATQKGANAASVGPNCPPNIDGCEHGTHVAGIVAGKPTNTTVGVLAGVAPGAKLILVNVFQTYTPAICGSTTSCIGASTSDIVAGLDYVYSLKATIPNIVAASMSLGGGGSTTQCDTTQAAYKASIDRLRSAGIATVIASGNDGNAQQISSPACISSAISIGATTKQDAVATFSNGNKFLNLYAPGQDIASSVPNDNGASPGTSFAFLSGTSMATPAASGTIALLRQKLGTNINPATVVDTVLATLKSSGKPITDTRNGVTTSRVAIAAAVGATQPTQTTQTTQASTTTRTPTSRAATSRAAESASSPTSTGGLKPGFTLVYEDNDVQLFRRL